MLMNEGAEASRWTECIGLKLTCCKQKPAGLWPAGFVFRQRQLSLDAVVSDPDRRRHRDRRHREPPFPPP